MNGSIVFVHGTGVRLKNYLPSFRNAAAKAKEFGIERTLVECAWGDALGALFEGKSLPEGAKLQEKDEEDERQWYYLYEDPFHNLRPLTIPSTDVTADNPPPGQLPRREVVWKIVKEYKPTLELRALLDRGALTEYWPSAYKNIIDSEVPEKAYKAAGADTAEVSYELARALAAELTVCARAEGYSGPGRQLRGRIVDRLRVDWREHVFALTDRVGKIFAKLVTPLARSTRDAWSDTIAFAVGDILLYQANGEGILGFIRQKVTDAPKPVYLMGHSLGGIACFDLLATPKPPEVAGLVTFGSQAPFLYEIGALKSLKPPNVPKVFPRWLNLYDRNDFLSYVGAKLFKGVDDREISSGRPFPESHSAYLDDDRAWKAIQEFVK